MSAKASTSPASRSERRWSSPLSWLTSPYIVGGESMVRATVLAYLVLALLGACLTLAEYAGYPLPAVVYPLGFLAALVVASHKEDRVANPVSFVALSLAFGFFSTLFLDKTWDGVEYHASAIRLIADNQVYSHQVFSADGGGFQRGTWLWIQAYPKLLYLIPSGIVDWVPLEALKFQLLLFGFLLFRLLRQMQIDALTAAFACFCPVAINQLWTFYVDGICYLVGCILVVSTWKRRQGADSWMVVACAAIFAHAKLQGIVIAAPFIAYTAYLDLKERKSLLPYVLFGITLVAPYALNLVRFGHPLAPLMGSGKVDIISANVPGAFAGLPAPIATMKSLIFVDFANWQKAFAHDTRLMGWGVLFPLLLVISLVLALVKRIWLPFLLIAPLLALAFVHPAGWWGRYTPFFWLVPVIVFHQTRNRFLGGVIAVQILLSLTMVAKVNRYATNEINAEIQKIRRSGATVVLDDSLRCYGLENRFSKAGVPFRYDAVVGGARFPFTGEYFRLEGGQPALK